MKWIVSILMVSLCSFAFANDSKHMIMFGGGFDTDWSGSATKYDLESDSAVKDWDISNGSFTINYAYRIAPQFQVGVYLQNEVDKEEAKIKAGGKIVEESKTTSLALFGIYNFSEKIEHSFYLGFAIGTMRFESETKDTTGGTSDKEERDGNGTIYQIVFGKRFPLTIMGIQNLTYSPMITYEKMSNVGGDLKDLGIKGGEAFSLNILKFDLLF